MKITIIGTGYVGLVTGACFSEMGNSVTCVDVNQNKLENLEKGILPIYEPGLEELVLRNYENGSLNFSNSLGVTMQENKILFIAVGTPPKEDGSADLKYVLEVASEIGQNLNSYAVVIDKSTVPIGTADLVRVAIQAELDKRGLEVKFDVVSNPEFLKEGDAIDDFMRPDRIIIGASSKKAEKLMGELYAPFNKNHDKVQFMGIRDAEMTKYAANSMLATKISFMNEIAGICERLGVDVENVRKGIGSDSRIGYAFIYPGCGYGGSCFPKDVKALIGKSIEVGFDPKLLLAVEARNNDQKTVLFHKIKVHFNGQLKGKRITVWGLSFKPGTDDMREAPSVVLINQLIKAGAVVRAYDPVAMNEAKKEFSAGYFHDEMLVFSSNQYEALEGADAMVLVTEWKSFRQPDFELMKKNMNGHAIFDGRNQYQSVDIRNMGFVYYGIGR